MKIATKLKSQSSSAVEGEIEAVQEEGCEIGRWEEGKAIGKVGIGH